MPSQNQNQNQSLRPRLCALEKGDNGYGFHLHGEKGKSGQFIRLVEPDSPAETSGLRAGDRLVFVNGEDVENESHQQVVTRIRATVGRLELIVVDPDTEELLKRHNLKCMKTHVTHGVPLGGEEEEEEEEEGDAVVEVKDDKVEVMEMEEEENHGEEERTPAAPERNGDQYGGNEEDTTDDTNGETYEDTSRDTHEDTHEDAHEEVNEEVHREIHEEIHNEVYNEVHEENFDEFHEELHREVNKELSEENCEDSQKDTNENINENIKAETNENINAETNESIKAETANDSHEDTHEDIHQDIHEVIHEVIHDHVEKKLSIGSEQEVGTELRPRLCVIQRGSNGYGFNLHSERARPGQYIRAVDEDSPAERAGLLPKDRIVQVNNVPVEGKTHSEVVAAIKSGGAVTRLLVVDLETDAFFKRCRVAPTLEHLTGPLPEAVINGGMEEKINGRVAKEAERNSKLSVSPSPSNASSNASLTTPPTSTPPEGLITEAIPALNLTLQQVKELSHQKRSNKRAPPMDWTKKNELFSNL